MNKDSQMRQSLSPKEIEASIRKIVIKLAKKYGFMQYDQVVKELSTLLNTEMSKALSIEIKQAKKEIKNKLQRHGSLKGDVYYAEDVDELLSPEKQNLDKGLNQTPQKHHNCKGAYPSWETASSPNGTVKWCYGCSRTWYLNGKEAHLWDPLTCPNCKNIVSSLPHMIGGSECEDVL